MTKVRACGKNWNWIWGKGKQNYAQEGTATAQNLKMKLQSWLGDCFFEHNHGMEWERYFSTKMTNEEIQKAVYNKILLQEDVVGVQEVLVETDFDNRKMKINYSYIDIYGNTIEEMINV